jgi:hypothetical protein
MSSQGGQCACAVEGKSPSTIRGYRQSLERLQQVARDRGRDDAPQLTSPPALAASEGALRESIGNSTQAGEIGERGSRNFPFRNEAVRREWLAAASGHVRIGAYRRIVGTRSAESPDAFARCNVEELVRRPGARSP